MPRKNIGKPTSHLPFLSSPLLNEVRLGHKAGVGASRQRLRPVVMCRPRRDQSERKLGAGTPMTTTGNGGRPVGLPKTGGRTKGTPNRATLALREKLEAIGCDPFIELAKMGMNDKNSGELRERCLNDLLPYLYPKRKPVDMSSDDPAVINVKTELDPGSTDGGDQSNPGA